MNYEFNGLLDSILPNIYINRITLEQKNTQPLSNNKYDMTPHINQTIIPDNATSLTPDYGGFEDKLKVTFDLFLEIPNIDSNDFWKEILSQEFSKYLQVHIVLFKDNKAKEYYKKLLGQSSTAWPGTTVTPNAQDMIYFLQTGVSPHGDLGPNATWSFWDLTQGVDYEYIKISNIFSHLIASVGGSDIMSSKEKFHHIKEKYTKILPDGTIVHKVPIQMSTEINGAFPSDLAAIAYSAPLASEFSEVLTMYGVENMSSPVAGDDNAVPTHPTGRLATEVIIQNGKIQDRGMIFFVSAKQDSLEFKHMEGQLWFGGVHKNIDNDGNNRYAAGNEHSEFSHPYLDYIIVPNQRIQDFRQIAIMQKHVANFNPITQLIFGGDYIDLRSNTAAASFDNYGTFSNLLTAVDKGKYVKLFFSIDWGKLLKKHCAVPALMDKLASDQTDESTNELKMMMNATATPVSFKVFRERIGGPTETRVVDTKNNASIMINRLGRELIYDNYPALYYFKNKKDPANNAASSLLPIKLSPTFHSFNGFAKSYSLTDYDIGAISSGLFKYSVEIGIKDPTISFFVLGLDVMRAGTKALKKYMYLANGTGTELGKAAQLNYWNSYLGKFESGFIEKATDATGAYGFSIAPNDDPLLNLPLSIQYALTAFDFMMKLSKKDWTSLKVDISTEDTPTLSSEWKIAIANMLNPDTASPASITAVYEIFDTLTSHLNNFINSFSTAKMPKVDSGEFYEVDDAGNTVSFSGSPLLLTNSPVSSGTPQKNIIVTHTFEDPTELVNTTNFDAGYDVFANIKNKMNFSNGLKVMQLSLLSARSHQEYEKYFKANGTLDVPFHTKAPDPFGGGEYVANLSDAIDDGGLVPTSVFTVAMNEYVQGKWTQYTRLPLAIKDLNEENEYWKLINNIIRYKLNLAGNPGDESWLGYGGPGGKSKDQIPGSQFISNTMERILKEYQSLAYLGANFIHEHKAFWGEGEEGPKGGKGAFQKGVEGLPYAANYAELQELEKNGTLVPWAKNVKQERFLLSLAIQDYCNLKYFDKKLGSYNAGTKNSRINKFLKLDPSVVLHALPLQIKVLVACHNTINHTLIQWDKNYSTDNNLYIGEVAPNAPLDAANNKSLLLDKFGDFWYNHQNLFAVEYLSGYKTITPPSVPGLVPPSTKFENIYNSTIKTPVWSPLPTGLQYTGILLCRIKKLRFSFFNQGLYDLFDMPLYDEYFFLNSGNIPNNWVNQTKGQQITSDVGWA